MMRYAESTSVRVGLQFRKNLFKSSVSSLAKKIDSLVQLPCPEFCGKYP